MKRHEDRIAWYLGENTVKADIGAAKRGVIVDARITCFDSGDQPGHLRVGDVDDGVAQQAGFQEEPGLLEMSPALTCP